MAVRIATTSFLDAQLKGRVADADLLDGDTLAVTTGKFAVIQRR